eukprot:scaffold4225_cov183-Amphora_coffeaeformis.AAC.1
MKNKNNFFNFVSSWESNVLSIESHLKTFYIETPFTLYSRTETEASQTELEFYQVTLNTFLSNSLIENGDGNSYTSTALTGDAGIVLHPVPPPSTVTTFRKRKCQRSHLHYSQRVITRSSSIFVHM